MADDTGYAPSFSTGSAAQPGYAPSFVAPASTGFVQPTPAHPITSAAPAYAPSFDIHTPMGLTSHIESGNRDITQQIHDRNYNPATGAGTPGQSRLQIIDPTWRIYARKAGVDLNQYPSAKGAPPDVQAKVASFIPFDQWGPNTVAGVRAQFPWINPHDTLGTIQAQAAARGITGAPPGTTPSTTPGTTLNTPPPTQTASAPPAQQGGWQGAIANLTSDKTMDNLKGMTQDTSQPPPPPSGMEQQQAAAAMGNLRQQQVAAQAQGLAAALQQHAAQPLTWGGRPFGSGAGLQNEMAGGQTILGGQAIPMPPGMTLNSMGSLYGQA